MGRRRTYLERRWPDTAEFNSMLSKWKPAGSTILLGFVWKGFDLLSSEELSNLPASKNDEDLERTITQLLARRIRRAMSGFQPFDFIHGAYEWETRKAAPAQPPQYDMAFVWNNNERIMWPLEAKVLKTEKRVDRYVEGMKSKFLTCVYAPFSAEGAMLGYLVSGLPAEALSSIAAKLKSRLHHHPDFKSRDHKTSRHTREVPIGKRYPRIFRCHHMIMPVGINP